MNLERLSAGRYQLSGDVGFDSALTTRKLVEEALDAEEEKLDLVLAQTQGNSVLVALMMGWFRYAHDHEKEIAYLEVPDRISQMIEFSGLDDVLPLANGGQAS